MLTVSVEDVVEHEKIASKAVHEADYQFSVNFISEHFMYN